MYIRLLIRFHLHVYEKGKYISSISCCSSFLYLSVPISLPLFQTSSNRSASICFDVTNCRYDDVDCIVPDGFSHLLEEIHRLETELGHLPQKWKVLWDKLELPTADSLTVSFGMLLSSESV
jgi:hypothetical protein